MLSPEIVAGLVGAAATAVLAILNSYLSSRTQVAEEVRKARLESYPKLWRLTSLLSVWPRTDPKLEHLKRLHRDLRRWYFDIGGLYLSENARDRYGEVQEILALVLANFDSLEYPNGQPSGKTYEDLRDTCSALRHALTEDLETRAQRSVLRSVRLIWRHRWQGQQAKKRMAGIGKMPKEPERIEPESWQQPDPPASPDPAI